MRGAGVEDGGLQGFGVAPEGRRGRGGVQGLSTGTLALALALTLAKSSAPPCRAARPGPRGAWHGLARRGRAWGERGARGARGGRGGPGPQALTAGAGRRAGVSAQDHHHPRREE